MNTLKSVRKPRESTQAVLVPYLVLAALFTAALVVCNLLSNKFIEIKDTPIDDSMKQMTFENMAGNVPMLFLVKSNN
mgnify:CR=1 FL=1